MRKLLGFLILAIISTKSLAADISDQLKKLEGLYDRGSITEKEFLKAKSILLQIDLETSQKVEKIQKKFDKPKASDFIIRPFRSNLGVSFERMEMLFGDYRIYTHRPGGVKVRRISDGKQLVVLSDKFKVNYFNDGEDIFDFKIDEKNKKISMLYNEVPVLYWEGRYINKHRAYFFQMLALGTKPFHFYIKLPHGKQVALNMEKFNKKIDLALAKVKIELAARFNITQKQIEMILNQREKQVTRELDSIVQKEKDKLISKSTEDILRASLDKAVTEELAQALEASVGKAMADEFVAAIEKASGEAIDDAISNELASAIDQAIAEAVQEGISEAAAAAGIQAALDVWARGGSDQEAWDAACDAAGQERGC